jgi:hypothetical protein
MSISVRCEECDKTYQVKDDKAGRRGKCPQGHSVRIPALAAAPPAATPVEEDAFAFATEAPNPKTGRRPPPPPEQDVNPISSADDSDFAFPTQVAGSDERDSGPAPKTGRQRRPEGKPAAKDGKPNLMPLYLGGILALLGIGGGVGTLVVSRGEVGPLRDQAEAANKKAAAAEERAQKAESFKLLAEADLEKLKKNPPRDPAYADAQSRLKAAEKRADAAERAAKDAPKKETGADAVMPAKAADLDPSAPGGKKDPVMPSGKLEAKSNDKMAAPDGPPKGGKSWTAPASVTVGSVTLKAGDRLWLHAAEDAVLKADAGKLTVKFRWQLRPGKELPKDAVATLLFAEAKMATALHAPVKLSGTGGEAEVVFNIRGATGKLAVYVVISDGKGDPSGKGVVAQSTILALQAEFPGQ